MSFEISTDNILPTRLRSSRASYSTSRDTASKAALRNLQADLDLANQMRGCIERAKEVMEEIFCGPISDRPVVGMSSKQRSELKKYLSNLVESFDSVLSKIESSRISKRYTESSSNINVFKTKVDLESSFQAGLKEFNGLYSLLKLEINNVNKQFNYWKSLKNFLLAEDLTELLTMFSIHETLLQKYLNGNSFSKSDWVKGRKLCRIFRRYIQSFKVDKTSADWSARMNCVLLVHYAVKQYRALYKAWR